MYLLSFNTTTKAMTFVVGTALLLMLTPKHGLLPERPSGVRTAFELLGKKQTAPRRESHP